MAESISSNDHESKSYWEKELEKSSLREPPMKAKLQWLKPLSIMHRMEFRGLDKRDFYVPQKHDAYEYQVWNIPSTRRSICPDYYIDYMKCVDHVQNTFYVRNQFAKKKKDYCWKMHDNYVNCKRET